MKRIKPLPGYLQRRYQGWKATGYAENQPWYRRMATDGQHPRAMVISCCDSRVSVSSIFGADQGEFFIHRNIANLIPPYEPDGNHHGTSAAIDYAVRSLKVAHLIVLGHSGCGGVTGCIDMCRGDAPDMDKPDSFVGRWLDILRPKYAEVADVTPAEKQQRALEHHAIVCSLENLVTFPFVSDAVNEGALSLHGLWTDIGEGSLHQYIASEERFVEVT